MAAALSVGGTLAYYCEQAAEHALQSTAQSREQAERAAEEASLEKRLRQPCVDASVAAFFALVHPTLSATPDQLAVVTLGCTPTPQQWRTAEARQAARHREELAAQRREELQAERLDQMLKARHRSAAKATEINKQQLAAYQTDYRAALQAAGRAKAVAADLGNQAKAARLMLDQKRAALVKLESSFDELDATIRKERPEALRYSTMVAGKPRDPATEIQYGSTEETVKGPLVIRRFNAKVLHSQQMVSSARALIAQVNHYQETYDSLLARRDAQMQEMNRMIGQANRLAEDYNSLLAQDQTQRQ